MATNIIVTPLATLCTFGFQNTFDRNIVGSRNIAASEANLKNETYKSNRNFRTKLCNLSKKDKLILRYATVFFNSSHNFLNMRVNSIVYWPVIYADT